MFKNIFKQSRRTCWWIGVNIYPIDFETLFIRLNNSIDHVAELCGDVESKKSISRIRTKSTHAIGKLFAYHKTQNHISKSLKPFFVPTKMGYLCWFSVPDYYICLSCHNRRHEIFDIFSRVLIVGIGIDDNIGSALECVINSVGKCAPKSSIFVKKKYMMNPDFFGNFTSGIGTSIIDNLVLYRIDPGDFFGKFGYDGGKMVFFVFAGNLNNKFHDCVL